MKECEEARGGVASSSILSHDLTGTGDISSSSQIISQQLVDFRNIEELQEQNQRLLGVVRELSEQNEEQERRTVEEQTRVSLIIGMQRVAVLNWTLLCKCKDKLRTM